MTLGLDTQTIGASIMARLISDSAGSAARAVIGISSSLTPIIGQPLAVFAIERLARVRQIAPAPPPIWVAVERGSASGRSRLDMRYVPFDLWCYDTEDQGAWRLEGLAPLLDALYGNVIIATGRVTVDLITNPIFDDALSMLAMRVRLSCAIWR